MINASYAGSTEPNNTKGLLFKLKFSGNTGVQGVGDLVNLAPIQAGSNPNGVTDPNLDYNLILAEPPGNVGVFSEDLAGYYIQLQPNANPTLANLGVRLFAPGGGEVASNTPYAGLANWPAGASATILAFIPLQ